MSATVLKKSGQKLSGGSSRLKPDDWLRAALVLLGETGDPKAIRIEVLCERLGVTKGSFYWHFKGRAGLIEAMIDYWADENQKEIHAGLGALPEDDPVGFFQAVVAFWDEGSFAAADTAMRRWAAHDQRVAKAIASADHYLMDRFILMFEKLGHEPDAARHRALIVMGLGVAAPQMMHLVPYTPDLTAHAEKHALMDLLMKL